MVSHNEDVEDIIVQGLANKERRNILKVIKLAKDGAIYSNILDELELNSVPISMNFTYLGTVVDTNAPLPPYQTATGRENVSPPISGVGEYPLIIQALATNGTNYNYQTTITAHT